jgi:DNA-directed RNA polymerase specialized sigma subunit
MLVDDLLAAHDQRARETVDLAYREDLLRRGVAERVGCSRTHVSRILRDALNRARVRADLALATTPQGASA